jgi:hypothetical protein
VLIGVSQEAWALIGLVIFLAASVTAFIWGYSVPNTTVEGEIAAASWRGYRASVADKAYEPNLDTDLPYIVGMGLLGKLSSRLKAASERGYSPSWFHAGSASGTGGGGNQYISSMGFYPYWLVFHSSMAPVSSGGGSASGGFSGGGAAGGGGGSAGSF